MQVDEQRISETVEAVSRIQADLVAGAARAADAFAAMGEQWRRIGESIPPHPFAALRLPPRA
jgi:hypothetical protein